MINSPPEFELRGQAQTGIGVNGNRAADADSDFCATLLAMASHDLRQPLQVIIGAHDLLARISHGGAMRAQLTRAEDATRQLTDILDLLVEALRLREFPTGNHREPVPLGPLLAQLASEFAEPARLRGIQLRVISAGAAVFSQPVLLTGIMRNLMRNAIDYTPPGGRVLVVCRRCGSQMRLEVRDSGVGIPADQLAKVFRAFHRADATRSAGLGLGLFIVKRAAELLRHDVQVCSAVGRGSCFAVISDVASTSITATGPAGVIPRRQHGRP